jgi:protein-tyrosine phosphatase
MPGWHAVHRLEFHDIEVEMPDEPFDLMSEQQAQDLVKFVHSIVSDVEGIIVHCRAGISRSATVAKWIAEVYGIKFNYAYDRYNMHVYKLLVEANQDKR